MGGPEPGQAPLDDPNAASEHIKKWREENEITVGGNCPDPWLTFDEAPLSAQVRAEINRAGFPKPSLIQSQSWPAVCSGRDVVGVAKTGSGKTLAFLVPAFNHITQHRPDSRNGPSCLVLAPTRELATQIQAECAKFGRSDGMTSTCLYGGAPKGPQLNDIRSGIHVAVATPGRLDDFP